MTRRYAVIIAPHARKQIDKLQSAMKERLANALEVLARDPYAGKALKWDLKGLYSYRVGDFRVIYQIVKDKLIVEIIKVMHRREAYQ